MLRAALFRTIRPLLNALVFVGLGFGTLSHAAGSGAEFVATKSYPFLVTMVMSAVQSQKNQLRFCF